MIKKEMIEKPSRLWLYTAIPLTVYVALNAILMYYHEPWRDEAQAWLMARDLSPFDLIMKMADEGHPCLWHLILMPFAKLGFPFRTIEFISLAVMTLSGWLLLRFAPFNKLVRVIILFSPAFVYYLPVIARSYCLIVLFVVMLCIFYPMRHEKPFRFGLTIALLVQTHLLMIGFAALMCISWLIESVVGLIRDKKRFQIVNWLCALGIPLLSALFFAWQTLREVNHNVMIYSTSPGFVDSIYLMYISVRSSFIEGAGFTGLFALIPMLLIAAIIVLVFLFSKQRWQTIVAGSAIFFFYFVFAFVYSFSQQKLLGVSFVLIWLCWVAVPSLKRKHKTTLIIILCIFCLLFPVTAASDILDDIRRPYSDSVNAANYIRENISPQAIILAPDTGSASSVLALLPNQYSFYHPQTESIRSYMTWSTGEPKMTYLDLYNWAIETFPNKEIYLIMGEFRHIVDEYGQLDLIDPVYCSEQDSIVAFETYRIYRIQ